ncbi:MAG TPA: protein kinase [Pyrinomonadaceae bacterium]|jgi:tetratricopeptide (TPR) repeat protein|nr:protein kinase [Pyrinomonadaceae bacterium]
MVDSQQTRILPDELRPTVPAPGTILRERYRLDSELGRGGMGTVYRATDLELQREVAVKVLSATSQNSEARERLVREARAAAALNHPHIVTIHDVGEASGLPFLVMELVAGPRLSQARPTEISRVVDIAVQICDALEHAHANQIVHRDLKPDNVLLSGTSEASTVKLADLGLALPAYGARISRAGVIVGTAAYMAPEQALGQAVDGRADLYALGVLLYELTTGRVPFKGDDPLTIVSQHVHAPVVPPRVLRSDIPPALEALIVRLLAKDPAQRFSTAAETRAALLDSLKSKDGSVPAETGPVAAILDALSRGRLVGRAAELAEARELWQRAREGRGHAVLLSGEPGAGKTRLAREITIQAAVDGALVLSGGCYEYEAATPYLPFVEAFRRWVREEKSDDTLRALLGDAATQIAKLAPEIETRLGPFPERQELAAHEERLLFFDAVVQVFSNIARRQSLLFYADDLHWADRGTLWLLGHLLRQLRDERVLIFGAYRETELDRAHPLAKSLVDWNRERLITRIVLRRFNESETGDQLGALLGEQVSGEFAVAVHRETEGNPFFVEEVLKALIERGSVRRESGRWRRCDMDELLIPQSVKEAIGNRLDRVSQNTNEVLRVSAILGKVFTFEDLSAVAEQDEDTLLDALDEATGAQLIAPGSGDSFSFTHDKIREVLYEELNPIRRRRLHRRVAEGLERNREAICCTVEKLAHHYIQAGDHQRGLEYAKQAAAEAARVFAFDEAIAAYGRARDCAEALGLTEEQLEQEEAIGKAFMLHGDTIPAAEHFERALALATDPATRARLQCQAAASLVTTGDPRGSEYLREALQVLDPVTNPLETANALSTEARFHHLAGRHKKAIELLLRSSELVAPAAEGDSVSSFAAPMISQIYAFTAGGYQHFGLYDEADRWARCAIAFGEKHNVLFAQAVGNEFLGEDCVHTGNFRGGLEYAEREIEIANKLRSRERRVWTHFYSAQCHLFLDEIERAEQEFLDGITLAESIGENRVLSLLRPSYAIVQAIQGRYDEALQTAEANLRRSSPSLLYSHFEALRCFAEVRRRRSEIEEAEQLCRQAEELVSPTDSRVSRLWLGPLYIEVLLAAHKRDEAVNKLTAYQALVAECQSPRFSNEATRLAAKIN